jgi:hypothetical protein
MSGTLTTTTTVERKRWFSGAFTYYAKKPSSFSDIESRVQELNYLYGLAPTPEAIWDLTPWSWAADWIANMGDVLNNLSMYLTDGLVMRYGYVMEKTTTTVAYTHAGTNLKGVGPIFPSQTFRSITKRRRPATPFGFGLTYSGFNTRQWAILAALGISRGKNIAF